MAIGASMKNHTIFPSSHEEPTRVLFVFETRSDQMPLKLDGVLMISLFVQ
jgi:hypothetical protein